MTAGPGKQTSFRVKFWGVRGSYPTSTRDTLKVGGHTACVEAQVGGAHLIFDAGTGIIPLGLRLVNQKMSTPLNLFLTHTHHDHIFGLYFFEPLHDAKKRVVIFGPDGNRSPFIKTLRAAMAEHFFPVGFDQLRGCRSVYSLKGGERIRLNGADPAISRKGKVSEDPDGREVTILTHKSAAHPNGVILYRVYFHGKSFVFATDIEQNREGHRDSVDFFRGADLLIHDAQYLESEYSSASRSHQGWGHSTAERAVQVARKAGVKQLVLFHHDPHHDDRTLKRIERLSQRQLPATRIAYEGLEIEL